MQVLKFGFFLSLIFAGQLLFAGSAEAQKMTLPAVGGWNGFLDQQNVVECSNAGNAATLKLTVRDPSGTSLGVVPFTLAAQGSQHIVLNSFPIANKYGTYNIELTSGDGTQISCITVFYRASKPGSKEAFEYAFAIPVEDAVKGEVSGVFNSFDALGGTKPVFNWLSIVNESTTDFSGYVYVYNMDGSQDSSRTIRVLGLKPNARQDLALGHDRGLTIGLYRVVPDNAAQAFAAFLTRYGQGDAAGSYAYAFPLRAQKPTCNLEPIHASTMANAFNWGELANPNATPMTVKATIYSRFGQQMGEQRTITIAPHSQSHIPLHEYLGPENIGTLHVECVGSGAGILAQSVFYGRSSSSRTQLEWVYAAQSRQKSILNQARALTHINTFLNAWNWSKTLSSANQSLAADFRTYAANGTMVDQDTTQIAAEGTWDFGIHEGTGANFIGMGLQPLAGGPGNMTGEVLRVIPKNDGTIGYIFNIPDRIIGESVPPDQVDSDSDGIPDVWEKLYSLDPYNAADGSADIDGDRLSNLEEYRRGLNPWISDSSFSGNPNSLAPYLGQLTAEEVRFMGKKFALNDDRLMTWESPRTDRQTLVNTLLSDDFFSQDLQAELIRFRDHPKNVINYQPWTPAYPVISKDNPIQTTAQIHRAADEMFDYLAQAYNGLTYTTFYSGYSVPFYLYMRSRYESPLHSIMAHLWGGHFGIDMSTYDGPSHMWAKGWVIDTLYGKGLGNFRDMLVGNAATQGCLTGPQGERTASADGVICQTAPLNYLNNDLNSKTAPNENFAREFMELFTLGPIDRWTRQANYGQETVRAATAFLSGYRMDWWTVPNYAHYFDYYDPALHDTRSFTAFPGTSYALSGTATPAQFANHLLSNHPGVPRFIAGKLFSMLVYPNPPEAIVTQAAAKFKGEFNYDIRKLVDYFLNSEAMYSQRARQRNCIIEPYKSFMKVARGFQLPLVTTTSVSTAQIPLTSSYLLNEWHASMARAGENNFNYPDVFAYDYCGRYANDNIDGSGEWLGASKLLGRFTGLTIALDRTLDYYPDAPGILRIKNLIPKTGAGGKMTPDDVIRYYQKMFDAELGSNEYTVIRNYLISSNASSAPNESVWNPTNDAFLKSKFAGMLLIFANMPQGNLE